jgi:hypothetical protein
MHRRPTSEAGRDLLVADGFSASNSSSHAHPHSKSIVRSNGVNPVM